MNLLENCELNELFHSELTVDVYIITNKLAGT